MCISPATCLPTPAFRIKPSTRCRWRPSRTRLRSIWCSSSSRRTSRASPSSRCSARRTSRSRSTARRSPRSDVAALNRALSDEGYFGGVEHLRAFAESGRWKAATGGRRVRPRSCARSRRTNARRCSSTRFWRFSTRTIAFPRSAIRCASATCAPAARCCRRFMDCGGRTQHLDDSPVELAEVAAMIRRWIEGQTFAPRAGAAGVQLLDAQAARYGEFDEVFLVGLVEGEWPQRSTKSIFYPASLLSQLDWPDSRVALAGERAAFQDLMALARRQVHLSTFELENDAIIGPSVFLEDVDRLGLPHCRVRRSGRRPACSSTRRSTSDPVAPVGRRRGGGGWLALRTATVGGGGGSVSRRRPRRTSPAAYSVSSLERYLQCPFRFFAERVLSLRGRSGRRSHAESERARHLRPRSLPEVLRGVEPAGASRRLRPENLPQAREIFSEVIEPLLATLPEDEAAVQRTRLLGSAADEGLAEAVFQVEAEWETPVVERLLEHSLNGEFEIQDGDRDHGALRCEAKPIASICWQDGTFRIIDYKLSRAPDRKLALQLPIYTVCTVQHLRQTRGEDWEPGQAGYIAFGQDRQFVPDARAREEQGRDARSTRRRACSMRSTGSSAASFRRRRRTP